MTRSSSDSRYALRATLPTPRRSAAPPRVGGSLSDGFGEGRGGAGLRVRQWGFGGLRARLGWFGGLRARQWGFGGLRQWWFGGAGLRARQWGFGGAGLRARQAVTGLALAALLVVAACDPYDPCAGRDLGPPDGIELTAENHEGWGESQCFACHVRARIHDEACVPGVDLAALQQADLEPCSQCHGTNGVPTDTGEAR